MKVFFTFLSFGKDIFAVNTTVGDKKVFSYDLNQPLKFFWNMKNSLGLVSRHNCELRIG